ncbi:hypothetical protein AAKU55_003576 [Oxalobacteraceae bacterium GrIS 1.11]
MGLFKRRARRTAPDCAALGVSLIALRLDNGDAAPAGATLVLFDAAGRARRSAAGRVKLADGEAAHCFHPGPYGIDLVPFAAAPELGLRLRFAVDAADPRVSQQRFDLYLLSEAGARLRLDDFGTAMQAALQLELAQGNMELPPCTTSAEWDVFRAGLNRLLYMRFGVTVDDCVPIELVGVDFARMLEARAQAVAAAPAPGALPMLEAQPPPADDARSLRRLFLELPAATGALRLIALPPGQEWFQARQRLLRRLELASLGVCTMPALEWVAPGQRLDACQQARRAGASAGAVRALDEAWALLARFQCAVPQPLPLLDEAERICANLEHSLAQRRAPFAPLRQDERGESS